MKLLSLPWILPQIVTYMVVEKGMENNGKFGKTMIRALELLWLVKRHILRKGSVE